MAEQLLNENAWNSLSLGGKKKGGYSISSYEVSASWYNTQIVNTGNRLLRLQRYHDMDQYTTEISRALDIIAEDVSSANADEDQLRLAYPDDSKVKKTAMKVMEQVFATWDKRTDTSKNLFERVRNTLKYGATFYRKEPDGSRKYIRPETLIGYILDPNDEEKVTHYIRDPSIRKLQDRDRTKSTEEQLKKERNIETIPVKDLMIFKIGNDPFGESILEKVYTVWRQMTLLEDAIIIYRVVRAPERRIYYIDVGNLQGARREEAINKQRLRLMQKQSNKNGKLSTEFDPHATSEDIFIPTNSTGKGSRIETLQGGQNLGELSDLEYFSRKLAAGLRIPHSMIDTHGDQREQFSDMRIGQLYQIEMRYMGYVRRFSRMFEEVLNLDYQEFCAKRDIVQPEGLLIEIAPSMSFALYKEMELNQSALNLYNSTIQMNSMSRRFAFQKYLNMDHEELANNEIDKLKEFGLTDEQIKEMPDQDISNLVYGDGRVGEKYGITPQEGGRGFGF